MYQINTPVVYIHERIGKDQVCLERMKRMMSAINTNKVETVTEKKLDELGFGLGGYHKKEQLRSIYSDLNDPVVIFDGHKWGDTRPAWVQMRNIKYLLESEGVVCQNGYGLRFASGCLHKCAYCERTRSIRIYLNLEEFLEHIDRHIKKYPDYRHYFADGETDLMCLEPEYGASEMMIRYFAQQDNKYLHLTTKSNNVDYLLNLEQRGKTILSWTISPPTMAQLIERGVPSFEQRLEAMRKCQKAGYLVRCRFSPIIPLNNWENDYRDMIERLFQVVKPEVITLWAFSNTKFEDIELMFDPNLMEEEYVQAAAKAAHEMRDLKSSPFSPEIRAQIYRFVINEIKRVSPATLVSLCLETTDMWERLSKDLGMTQKKYFCNCGEKCIPGTDLYQEFVLKYAS